MVILGKIEALVIIVIFALFPFFKGIGLSIKGLVWKREFKSPLTYFWSLPVGFVVACRIERIGPLRGWWQQYGDSHGYLLFWLTVTVGVVIALIIRFFSIWLGASLRTLTKGNIRPNEQASPPDC